MRRLARSDDRRADRLFLQGAGVGGWPQLAIGDRRGVDDKSSSALHELLSQDPVVFVLVADPVGTGLIASLPRPGGNMTGFAPIVASLGGKWAELIKEIAPRVSRVTMLFNPPSATFIESFVKPFKTAASSLGMEAILAPVQDMAGVDLLVTIEARRPNSALVVIPDAFTESHRAEIVSLTVRHQVPAINWSRSFTDGGGLISYGPYLIEEYRRAATYADRIAFGPPAMSALRSLSGEKRTCRDGGQMSQFDPGCAKTLCRCYDSPVDSRGN